MPKLCLPKLVLTWHALQAFPTAAQRLLNYDTDLADGLALGALLISHIPRLAFLSSQLNLAPTTPAELQNNAILVIKMTVEIQLPWPLQVQFLNSLWEAPAACVTLVKCLGPGRQMLDCTTEWGGWLVHSWAHSLQRASAACMAFSIICRCPGRQIHNGSAGMPWTTYCMT